MSSPVHGYVSASALWRPGTSTLLRWEPELLTRDLSADVVQRVLADPPSTLPPVSATPRPRGDVDRPYRLALSPFGDDGLVCLRATIAARSDASGATQLRLAGLLVDPSAVGSAVLRPADLWDAGIWSAAPGPRPATDLRHGSLDDASLAAFSRAHPDQREVVLAAVEHAAGTGGPLLVVGDDPVATAHWAWLVGRLLLPAVAWRLPFSTCERLLAPRPPGAVPFALAGVPSADAGAAGALAGPGFTVLADDEQPVRGGRDRWALRSGPPVAVGPWARLAEAVVVLDLLPEVTARLDALGAEVSTAGMGNAALRRPLWALGAAVLLLDDVEDLGDLAADAAHLAREQWPPDLGTDGPRLQRVSGLVAAHARSPAAVAGTPDAPTSRLDALWEDLRTRFPPDTGESLTRNWSRLSGAVRRGVEVARQRGREWRAGDDLPASVLEVAGLLDGSPALAQDRREVVELAREILVPALLDGRTDPARAGWEPVPGWLWEELVPVLGGSPQLEYGVELPGHNLSAATHEWLGALSIPSGQLTVEGLRGTGPVEWERAAYRLFVRRAVDVTPLERAAAFLRTVYCAAVNEGRPVDHWAGSAAEDVYAGGSLDVATAGVLMDVLPAGIPFSLALAAVLQRTAPSPATRAAVTRLRRREVVPIVLAGLVERHER